MGCGASSQQRYSPATSDEAPLKGMSGDVKSEGQSWSVGTPEERARQGRNRSDAIGDEPVNQAYCQSIAAVVPEPVAVVGPTALPADTGERTRRRSEAIGDAMEHQKYCAEAVFAVPDNESPATLRAAPATRERRRSEAIGDQAEHFAYMQAAIAAAELPHELKQTDELTQCLMQRMAPAQATANPEVDAPSSAS